MLDFLKNHPFPVAAHFTQSTVLTFAVPKAQLQSFLPESISLDTFNDEFGFIAVAMVDTKNLRPKGFPEFMGNNFFLIGYRIFVKYVDNRGKRLRGLYIIKSETNKKKMEFFGNIFTHYNYTTTDISFAEKGNLAEISSEKSGFKLIFEEKEDAVLPETSPFENWKQARRFAGPLPFTFTYEETKKQMLIIQGVRQNWTPKAITVIDQHFDFIEKLNLKGVKLANAFVIKNVPYHWEKGKKELWKP